MTLKPLTLCLVLLCAFMPAQAATIAIEKTTAEPVDLIRSEVGARRLIVLGEMHGTREIAPLVGNLVSAYAAEGPVLLGLEIDQSQAEALRRYLASDGGPGARSALRALPYWHVEPAKNDGRRTEDVLALIERVRVLKHDGRDVAVLAYDTGSRGGNSELRDQQMATRLRTAMTALPRGRLVVLTGNVHAMRARPDFPFGTRMQTPMTSYLTDLGAYSINITANGGEFWGCAPVCGPHRLVAMSAASGRSDDGRYDLIIVLPHFSVAQLIGPAAVP